MEPQSLEVLRTWKNSPLSNKAWSQGCPSSEQDFGVDKLLKSLAPWVILWFNLFFFPSHFSPQTYKSIFLIKHFLKQWSWWDPPFSRGLSTLLECKWGKAGPLPCLELDWTGEIADQTGRIADQTGRITNLTGRIAGCSLDWQQREWIRMRVAIQILERRVKTGSWLPSYLGRDPVEEMEKRQKLPLLSSSWLLLAEQYSRIGCHKLQMLRTSNELLKKKRNLAYATLSCTLIEN